MIGLKGLKLKKELLGDIVKRVLTKWSKEKIKICHEETSNFIFIYLSDSDIKFRYIHYSFNDSEILDEMMD